MLHKKPTSWISGVLLPKEGKEKQEKFKKREKKEKKAEGRRRKGSTKYTEHQQWTTIKLN